MNYQEQQRMRDRMKEMERLVREFSEKLTAALERIAALEATRTLRLPKK